MVGNSQSKFTVKIHTFIPRNSYEFQKPFCKGESILNVSKATDSCRYLPQK